MKEKLYHDVFKSLLYYYEYINGKKEVKRKRKQTVIKG